MNFRVVVVFSPNQFHILFIVLRNSISNCSLFLMYFSVITYKTNWKPTDKKWVSIHNSTVCASICNYFKIVRHVWPYFLFPEFSWKMYGGLLFDSKHISLSKCATMYFNGVRMSFNFYTNNQPLSPIGKWPFFCIIL